MMQVDSNRFYDAVPVLHRFADIADLSRYQPLPDDWMLGLPDVVQSTQAMRENRYKAVNMAGAAVIGAVANASAPRLRGRWGELRGAPGRQRSDRYSIRRDRSLGAR